MTVYRKKEGSDVWHWCTNCPEYPTGENVIERHSRPDYGTLCSLCEVKDRAGDCKKDSLFSVRK
ncbi:hypothetical protein [Thermodesulforhabdus norvegica]|uniref:Uncharacterized protein n=1 Tax=Thermodesulforhabdus norvegica TaxID=39841 RepID=A0A1I4VRU8_9BACT|nr:hypothetical protein [Thermodesulforhabdus norvegica]SFN03998.1 hypothetical protein SAMN05660836_02435 [Thermodesulforhabdus norvegica]